LGNKKIEIDKEAFKKAYLAKTSLAELARQFGICRSSVSKLIRSMKLREIELRDYNQIQIPLEAT
jgi:biotin operon repressor